MQSHNLNPVYKTQYFHSEKNYQGVSYSKKFHVKHGFPNLANGRASQFMFPKYLIEYRNVKIEGESKI